MPPGALDDSWRARIRAEAASIQNASLLAAERHYAAETPWWHWNLIIGIPATVLAAVAGAAAFSNITHSELVAGSISIIVAILSSLTTFIDPKKTFADHHASAKAYEALYRQAGFFYRIESLAESADEGTLQTKLSELSLRFNQLNERSLPISGSAIRHAAAVIKGDKPGEVIRDPETPSSTNRSESSAVSTGTVTVRA
ncbi:conserved hypothetical protein [Bradyrhizobium sp. STM 3843]|uniref:SLATT domain-containing protein n=1 Tax=Bradyrhizobium sp. STM 3843 TaxID=551947 RepID=UPI0002406B9F|nr:SLATT domain-containing protein [Bradyrhizobium sp. STM 3843]CCE05789.1 conserved hypothetical protein [Bradyrhizobium sp. STM 3843]